MRRCAPPTPAAPSADRRLTRCNLVLQAVEAAAKQLETDLAKGIDPNTLQQREEGREERPRVAAGHELDDARGAPGLRRPGVQRELLEVADQGSGEDAQIQRDRRAADALVPERRQH